MFFGISKSLYPDVVDRMKKSQMGIDKEQMAGGNSVRLAPEETSTQDSQEIELTSDSKDSCMC